MMPVIRISDAIFVDLKSVATWLGTDTPSQTIDRLVREKMEQLSLERDDAPADAAVRDAPNDEIEFQSAPGLSFTRVLEASVNGMAVKKANWVNVLLGTAGSVKTTRGLDPKALSNELQVPCKALEYEAEGYRYRPELGVSIQGQSAQDAWREISRLANKYRLPVEVRFQWRQNDKAQYPGRIGILRAGQ